MKTIVRHKISRDFNAVTFAGVFALVISGVMLHAADTTGAPVKSKGLELKPVPKSVFVIPSVPADGRDPFFPNSTRAPGSVQPEKQARTDSAPSQFVLNGVNLLPGSRTAIINGRTIAEGETAMIPTANGEVSVHLQEFKGNNSVVIQFGTQTQELHMRNE